MALTTHSMDSRNQEKKLPEYMVGIDAEDKGYLMKRPVVEEVKTEEIKSEPKSKDKSKKKRIPRRRKK